jgi:hypothetical protein
MLPNDPLAASLIRGTSQELAVGLTVEFKEICSDCKRRD